jgi:hypothetical protein
MGPCKAHMMNGWIGGTAGDLFAFPGGVAGSSGQAAESLTGHHTLCDSPEHEGRNPGDLCTVVLIPGGSMWLIIIALWVRWNRSLGLNG